MCSDEVVQLFYLSGSLSVGLNLLGGLAGNERSGQRHALAETYRADLNSQIGQGCRGMIGVVSSWRDGIQHHDDRCASGTDQSQGGLDRLKVQDRGSGKG